MNTKSTAGPDDVARHGAPTLAWHGGPEHAYTTGQQTEDDRHLSRWPGRRARRRLSWAGIVGALRAALWRGRGR